MSSGADVVRRQIAADPATVWAVLADGWLYPSWVVGAARMRAVDASWPAPGSTLQYSVGAWPLLLGDRTESLASEPPHRLVLRPRARLVGATEVVVEIEPAGGGSEVAIREHAVDGPGTLVPRRLRQRGIVARNREALRRLAFLAEGGAGTGDLSRAAPGSGRS